ncbi:hypothetical protein FBU30_005488 [Linnemannia zychae]|nr:hypothetical protein FBU30_005488 [Linnemannia zychae]
MATVALNKQIITYSTLTGGNVRLSGSSPILSSFDTITGVWSGPGLADGTLEGLSDGGGYASPPQQQVPIGAIIGGVVGRLIALTFAFFLYFNIKYRIHESRRVGSNGSRGTYSYRFGGSSAVRSQNNTRTDSKSGL